MVVGDWCRMPQRERCFESAHAARRPFALLKGGNLHGLDELPPTRTSRLFMFGGYD
jgi:hypothetical protein